MPSTENQVVSEAALRAALPHGSVRLRSRADGALSAVLPDGTKKALHLAWAGYGYPRDVQRALRDQRVVDARAKEDFVVIVAHMLSDGARQLLRAEGISWVGLDGSAELRLGTVWVDRDGSRTNRVVRPEVGWTRGRADVAEALLAIMAKREPEHPGTNDVPEVEALANRSGRSLGTVANTLALFDANGWTARAERSRSRTVADAPALLDSWSTWDAAQRRRFDGFHSIHRDPSRVVEQLVSAFGSSLLLTGAAASELVRPTLTGSHVVTAYVEVPNGWPDIDSITRSAKMIPAAVPRIRLAPASTVIANTTSIVSGMRVTSPARTYADLLAGSEREHEAAEAFRELALRQFS